MRKALDALPTEYEDLMRVELETTASIRRGLADVAAGCTRLAREAIKGLAKELGIALTKKSAR